MTPTPTDPARKAGPLRWFLRHYTRGLLALIVILVAAPLVASLWPAEEVESLWTWLSSGAADRWAIVIFAVLLVPAFISWVGGALVHPFLRRRRALRGWLAFEQNLVAELAPDEDSPVSIVLINWPSAEIRTVGVLASEFSDPETGEKLAAVFIPRGPNASQGTVRVIGRDNVQLTDWTLREYLAYQWSLGTAVPHGDEPSS